MAFNGSLKRTLNRLGGTALVSPCLICGVDSREIKTFLFLFIGGLALASICVIVWALGSKRFHFSEDKAAFAIEADSRTEATLKDPNKGDQE